MNFFAHLIKKPPVPDRDNNDIGSIPSQQFSITKQKQLKDFNDDMSQIQIGQENINEDSINQMKRQHKLLSGRRQSDQRSKPYNTDSKQFSAQYQHFQNGNGQYIQNKKKDSKNSKLSLQSKFTANQKLKTDQFVNLHRQYSMGSKILPLKLAFPRHKKNLSGLINQLTQLKHFKYNLKQFILQQTKRYKKMIQSVKIGLQIQIKKRMSLIYPTKQFKDNSQQLIKKLKQAQLGVKETSFKMEQLQKQNQDLQQRLFDYEQKIVGIDLEVEERFEMKRKELQKKIIGEIVKNNEISSLSPQLYNSNNSQVVNNLICQMNLLDSKCKSYQSMLLEADHFRKQQKQLEQRERKIRQKQRQLQNHKQQIEKNLRQNAKRSLDLSYAQQNLNKKLHSLKQDLKVKQDELQIWQQQLNMKSKLVNDRNNVLSSPRNNFPQYNSNNTQTYNLTFQKKKDNGRQSNLHNYEKRQKGVELLQKLQKLNFEKLQKPSFSPRNNSQFDTFRNTQNQQRNQQNRKFKIGSENNEKFSKLQSFTPGNGSVPIIYDPRKHEQYQHYDMNDRYRFNLNTLDKYSQDNYTERMASPRNYQSTPVNYSNKKNETSQNKLGSFKISLHNNNKVSPQFYKPNNNSFKYESQYMKPLSSPLNQISTHKEVKVHEKPSNIKGNQNNKNPSTNSRQYTSSNSYTKLNSNREKNNLVTIDRSNLYLDRSSFSKSSKDHSHNSHSYGHLKGKVAYQGYDMNKSKAKYEVGNLSSLGNKLQMLKSQLKNQIDSIL